MRALVLAGIVLSFCGLAQENRGSILGRVTDPSGAFVPNVDVHVVNVDTNTTLDVKTNEDGNYLAPFLLAGTYRVTAERAGFKKVEQNGIGVTTGSAVTINLALEVGAASETITVKETAPLLDSAGSDLGLNVPDNYVRDMPISFYRNAANFTRLAPGVVGQSPGTYTSDNQTQISISGGGGTQGSNEWIIDGVPDTVPLSSGSVVLVPSTESVQEMHVNTTMFDAEYGHSNGGAVTIVTKGGTNDLHGDIYLFKRWTALYANTWSNDRAGLPKGGINFHQDGFFLSGPVYIPKIYNGRNKTFFSVSVEYDNDVRDLSETAHVPTALERNGDFSQTLNSKGGALTIYNPFTTVVSGSNVTRTPFTNNMIPASLINPIASKVMALFPLPNLPGPPEISTPNWYIDRNYFVKEATQSERIDHYFSDRNRAFVRVGTPATQPTRDQFPDVLIPGINSVNGSGANLDTYLQWRTSVTLNDTATFSPSLVGSFSYGFARRHNNDSYGGYGLDPTQFGLPGVITANAAFKGYPEFNMQEGIPDIGSRINLIANNLHSTIATFTKMKGNHEIKFGFDGRLLQYNTGSQTTAAAASFTFSPTFTQSNPLTSSTSQTSGTGMASLLLGAAASGSFGYTSPLTLQSEYVAGFIQDSWKVSRKLTINLGLRYELETPYKERYNRVAYGFNPGAALPITIPEVSLHGGLEFAGVNGNPRSEGNLDTNNIGPRFGFAYQVNSKTVVRGGYGLFYASALDNLSDLGSVATFSPTTPYVGTTNSGETPFTTISNPYPNGLTPVLGSAPGLLAQVGNSLSFVNPKRVNPYTQQWQVGVQRELPSHVVVEASYVGSLALKFLESYNLNDLPAMYLPYGAAQNNAIPNPFLGIFPSNSTLGSGSTIPQKDLWVQYPQYSTLTEDGANTGVTTYHALQTRAEKRLSHNLSVIGTFTFSKTIHNNLTSLVNTYHYRSISSLDQPKLLNIAVVYALPFKFAGGGYQRVLRQVAGGWAIDNILIVNSGLPLSFTQANGRPLVVGNPALSGPVDQRLGDKTVNGVVQNPYFNINAFQALPSQYQLSPQVPYISQLRAPGLIDLNTTVFKNFPLYERVHLEVRLEIYNTTNHPYFNAPGTNMSSAGTFGVITGASNSRQMTGGIKLLF